MYRFQDVARPAATAAKHFVGVPRKLHVSTLYYNNNNNNIDCKLQAIFTKLTIGMAIVSVNWCV